MNVVVVGAKGQLGKALVARLNQDTLTLAGHDDFAVEDYSAVQNFFQGKNVDVIINLAAMHKVDQCESEYIYAYQVNTIGAYHLAKIAKMHDAIIVHVSTDYVFDGRSDVDYRENDLPSPINIYGASKLAGEHAVALATDKHYLIRTSALYGGVPTAKGKSFVLQMIDKARSGQKIVVVDDQFTVPTYVEHLADAIAQILEKRIPFGIYHAVSNGNTSWYGYANEIFSLMNITPDITSTQTNTTQGSVRRPLRSVLSNEKLAKHGIHFPHWSVSLGEYLNTLPKE